MVVFATNEAAEGVPRAAPTGQAVRRGTGGRLTEDGFAECYAASFQKLVTQLYAFTGDLALAHDLVQEAFCRALTRWARLSTYDDPVAWVRRVALNLAKSRWRRAKVALRYQRSQRQESVRGPSPDRVVAAAVLAKLPDNQRRAMVLHYLADLSVADIAVQEGVPVGTVKSWLHRGRVTMASLLAEREEPRDA